MAARNDGRDVVVAGWDEQPGNARSSFFAHPNVTRNIITLTSQGQTFWAFLAHQPGVVTMSHRATVGCHIGNEA